MIYWTIKEVDDYLKQFKIKKIVKKSKKGIEYYNIPITFDTETTSYVMDTLTGEVKTSLDWAKYKETHTSYDKERYIDRAIMYCWAICIDGKCLFARNWLDFEIFLKKAKQHFHLSPVKKLVIYVHNLAFDFQFFKSRLKFDSVFANDSHKIIYGENENFVFKCSYFLSGCSLETTGKNLTKYKAEKKVGDLDYNLIRHSKTPMSEREIEYVLYDVIVDNNFIKERMEQEKGCSILKLPLTKTGYVRRDVKKYCLEDLDYGRKIKEFTYDENNFPVLEECYAGAFTHANCINVDYVFENVYSEDFTSSYPYCLLAFEYPMGSFVKREINSIKDFKYCLKKYACLFRITFYNIRQKDNVYENIISFNKCRNIENYALNNGRVISASKLSLTINEIDFKCVKLFYDFGDIEIGDFYTYRKNYLPKRFKEKVIEYYKKKTELKDVAGKESEYALNKEMVNSVYGMCVTNPLREEWGLNDDDTWTYTEPNVAEMLEYFTNSRSRFIAFEWGIWCTSYARYNLYTGILELGSDYIYCDTDSLKFTNLEKHKAYFDKYNENVEKTLKEMCNKQGLDFNDLKPKTIKGEEKMIGVWDYEGMYKRFKTLGAKRYCYIGKNKETKEWEFNITCSGLNKKKCVPYLLEQAKIQNIDVFDLFSEGLYVPCENTGKNLHKYYDTPFKETIVDYMGIEYVVEEYSYCYLEPAGYDLSLADEFRLLIENKKLEYHKAY